MSALALFRRRLAGMRAASDRGIGLTELLVTMVILSLIMVMVMSFFVSASRAFTTNKTVDGNTRTVSVAMQEMSRMLRAATNNPVADLNTPPDPAFVLNDSTQVTTTTVTFYAFVNLASSDQTPVQVQFSVNPATSSVVEKQWAATRLLNGLWSFPLPSTPPTSTRNLGGPVLSVASGGPQLFTYLDQSGATIPLTGGALPAASVASVASVQVNLTFGTSTAAGKSVALQNTIGLPNLGLARTS